MIILMLTKTTIAWKMNKPFITRLPEMVYFRLDSPETP